MGFRLLLIAVTGKDPAVVQRDYGVAPTDEREETPESPVVGARLPGGAYLLYISDEILPGERVFARLSRGASLVACYVNETVMNSYACAGAEGVQRWSVFHDAQQGVHHLEVTGATPGEFQPIRDRQFARQSGDEEVDQVFDVPVELFAAPGGLRYDQDIPGAGPEPWEVLDRQG